MKPREWFVPTVAFAMFVYFMVFVIMYAIKIGGPNVSFYDPSQKSASEPVTDAEKHLKDISKEIRDKLGK